MRYFKHLFKNWKVSAHAMGDSFAHFIHGLLPFIKIKHHQPTKEAKPTERTVEPLVVYRAEPIRLFSELQVYREHQDIVGEDDIKRRLVRRLEDDLVKTIDFICEDDPIHCSKIYRARLLVYREEAEK